jgi:altronate hydrolase
VPGANGAGAAQVPRGSLAVSDLVVGTGCGGSDATSGITANSAVGLALIGWWKTTRG